MAELSQAQLEELVEGKPQKPRAVFYEKAALQVDESKLAGKRIYKTRVYIKLIQSGVTDNISFTAKPKDIEEFQEEYQYFLNNRQGSTKAVLIDIIPNLNIANKQELIDMGLSTIERLAAATVVPPHLEHIRQSAITFQKVLQEQSNGRQEESIEKESDSEEGRQESGIVNRINKSINLNPNVSASHRQDDTSDVGRSSVPDSGRGGEGSDSERVRTNRPIDNSQTVRPLLPVNWKMSF